MRKILILGRSEKIAIAVAEHFPKAKIETLPWRTLSFADNRGIDCEICIVCGFDFGLFLGAFKTFKEVNIEVPFAVLNNPKNKITKILYINTMRSAFSTTYSRYYFGKQALFQKLLTTGHSVFEICLPTIIDNTGKPSLNASAFERRLIMIVLQLLRINTLEESRLSHLIADIVASEPSSVMENTQQLDGKFLSIPRPQVIDRALRLLLG